MANVGKRFVRALGPTIWAACLSLIDLRWQLRVLLSAWDRAQRLTFAHRAPAASELFPRDPGKLFPNAVANAHALRKPSGWHVRCAIAHASPIASPLLRLGQAAHCRHQMRTHYGNQAGGTSDTRLHIHPRLLPHCFAWARLRPAAIKTPWPSDLSVGRSKQGGGRARLRSPCRILSSRPRRQPWQLQRACYQLRRHLKAELACDPCCNLQLQCGTRGSQAHVV